MAKHIVVHSYPGILLNNKKKNKLLAHTNQDGLQGPWAAFL